MSNISVKKIEVMRTFTADDFFRNTAKIKKIRFVDNATKPSTASIHRLLLNPSPIYNDARPGTITAKRINHLR